MTGSSGAPDVGSGYGEMLVGSLLVLGLVCLAAWVVVRFGARRLWAPRGGGVLDVLARVPLEPRRSLYVVEVAGKTLLVGTSEMGLAVLSELDGERLREDLGARPSARSFADALRAVLGRERVGGAARGVGGGIGDRIGDGRSSGDGRGNGGGRGTGDGSGDGRGGGDGNGGGRGSGDGRGSGSGGGHGDGRGNGDGGGDRRGAGDGGGDGPLARARDDEGAGG